MKYTPAPKNPPVRNPNRVSSFDPAADPAATVYPVSNPQAKGYGVDTPGGDPAKRGANGRMVNMFGQRIDFYIEEMEAKFELAGTTAQSRMRRQFFPHNMVQPSLTLRGRMPNSYQYNRLASFVRVAQHTGLNRGQWAADGRFDLRSFADPQTKEVTIIPTIRLLIASTVHTDAGRFPYEGVPKREGGPATDAQEKDGDYITKTVAGSHNSWKLEGYVKTMAAGAQRFDPAPSFEFEFLIAESQGGPGHPNLGIYRDFLVAGNELKRWTDIFSHPGQQGFVQDKPKESPEVKGENYDQDPNEFYDDGPYVNWQ